MADREKVIGHLNDCMEASRRDNTWVFVRKDIVEDAIVLLKEQEVELQKGRYYSDVFDIGYKAGKESIVRCRDCKYWSAERINDYNKCKRWINVGVKNFATMGYWFCADGVAKDINVPDKEGR